MENRAQQDYDAVFDALNAQAEAAQQACRPRSVVIVEDIERAMRA